MKLVGVAFSLVLITFGAATALAGDDNAALYAGEMREFQALVLSHGAIGAYFAAFALGIVADLSPCVYPLIPVTLAVIGAKRAPTKLRAFGVSAVFVLGIAVMYTVLGFIVAFAASQMNTQLLLGFSFQNRWAVGFVALVLFAMGLSMFGLFTMQLPAKWQERLARPGRGMTGVFVMGLVSGVIASPCTAPFLGGLLGYIILTGDLVHGTSLLFAFALGMGLPFLVLGTFTGILSSIPKSGTWLIWVKRSCGVMFVVAAIYFGQFALPKDWRRAIVGAVNETVGGPVAILAPPGTLAGKQVVWHPDAAAAAALALQKKMPMMIDFWGEYCAPCKVMDVDVFQNVDVVRELERFVSVKVDSTDDELPAVRETWKKYGVTGLPTLAFVDSDGRIHHDKKRFGAPRAPEVLATLRSMK